MPPDSDWLHRLLALPTIEPQDKESIRALGMFFAERQRIAPGRDLRPLQAEALGWAIGMGVPYLPMIALGVGHGKTATAFFLAKMCEVSQGKPLRILYLTPPRLVDQVIAERNLWAKHYDLHQVVYRADEEESQAVRRSKSRKVELLQPGVISIMKYSSLSSATFATALEDMRPDVIIADEAHTIAGQSARAKRVLRYLSAHHEHCTLIPMSGTAMSRRIVEASRLFQFALRDQSPLPYPEQAQAIDSLLSPDAAPSEHDLRALDSLRAWAGNPRKKKEAPRTMILEGRLALKRRLASSRGVVMTVDSAVDTGLCITHWTPPRVHSVDLAITNVLKKWTLPDGTELVDAAEMTRHVRSLCLGFYYPAQRGPTDWEEARSAWNKSLRTFIEYRNVPGYDTALAVEQGINRGKLTDTKLVRDYTNWIEARKTWRPPTRSSVWVDENKTILSEAVRFARAQGRATLWAKSIAVFDGLREIGVPTYAAGSNLPDTRDKVIGLSIGAWGTGWQGHEYHDAIVLDVPSGGDIFEQLLGRHHRPGQTEDVTYHINKGTMIHVAAFKKAVKWALYTQQKTGQHQKLLLADWAYEGIPRPREGDVDPGDSDQS